MAVPRHLGCTFPDRLSSVPATLCLLLPSNFYREEFIKCQRCLDAQREDDSDRAISEVEQAITKVLAQLDRLCTSADADRVVSRLLQQFDTVARPSAWSDPRHTH